MEHHLSFEEISWRQKSRMLCIKEGDNNTKFFHKMANSYRRYNHLRILEVDRVVFEKESEVTAQLVQFYKTLYQEPEGWRPFVVRSFLCCLRETSSFRRTGSFHRSFYLR